MKKSILLAFVLSLTCFLLINFLFFLIGYGIDGYFNTQLTYISNNPLYLLFKINQPMAHFPWTIIGFSSEAPAANVGEHLRYIMMIAVMFITAIIAGLAGGSVKNAFIGWVLTCVVSIIMLLIATYFVTSIYYVIWGSSGAAYSDIVIILLIVGIFYIALYGLLVVLIAFIAIKLKERK